jgi:ATP-dependent DNA ligase
MNNSRPKREGVMLAYPVDDGRIARLGKRFFVQPKLNGERCRVEWFHGEPVLMSSYANVIKGLGHIEKAVVELNDALSMTSKSPGELSYFPLDGELYIHGKTWSQIVSIAGRTVNAHSDAHTMEYHVFDIQLPHSPQVMRFSALDAVQEVFDAHPCLVRVPTYICNQGDQWNYAEHFIDLGYEGIILRDPIAPYYFKRNVCLLKYKPTESDEYEIVDVEEAISQEGHPKGMVGAFLVKSDDEVIFRVGAGKLRHLERTVLWQKRQKLTGLTLIVKHEKLRTVNDVPVAAVAVDVKEKV